MGHTFLVGGSGCTKKCDKRSRAGGKEKVVGAWQMVGYLVAL